MLIPALAENREFFTDYTKTLLPILEIRISHFANSLSRIKFHKIHLGLKLWSLHAVRCSVHLFVLSLTLLTIPSSQASLV